MQIQQVRLKKLAVFAYIIKDESTNTCALVDPAFETERILIQAQSGGCEVTHLINTHCHADHSAGNAAIVAATGAKLLIHELDADRLRKTFNKVFAKVLGGGGSPKPDILLKDGDIIEIGDTRLTVIHTPGHTPGGICLYGEKNVITGDTLFVNGIGRTDFPSGSLRQLLKSIHERLYVLPGDTVVWPGHDYGPSTASTIASEMRTNPFAGSVITG
ncbi:MAG: MBL fold metallo-hydrolase [Desulfatiglans sp.]|jgi:glyoxylase-like metal-dependent hydrolase (beta-lactamase superfamily II)|nr:MBL fold metallo-hydrolase [Desulfatiglans sp.]